MAYAVCLKIARKGYAILVCDECGKRYEFPAKQKPKPIRRKKDPV